MKKFLLFSLAGVLALGLSARVLNAQRAMQKPVTVAPAVALQKVDKATKLNVERPSKLMNLQDAKAGARISITAEGSANTAAYYSRSLGSFFTGYTVDGSGYRDWNFFTYTPAFYDATYTAYTDEGVIPSWVYYDAEDNEYDATGLTLTQSLGVDYVYAPEMTANDSTFSWGYMWPGGNAYTNSSGETFLASNTDHSWDGIWGLPNTTNLDDASEYFSNVEEGEGVLAGYAEFVNVDPEHPFILNGICVMVDCEEVGGTLNLKLYKAEQDENGNITSWSDEVIAEGEPVEIEPSETLQLINFPDLYTIDPDTGLDVPIIVNEPFVAVIYSEDGAQLTSIAHMHNMEIPTEAHAMLYFDFGGEPYLHEYNRPWVYASTGEVAGYTSSWEFNYDITYCYLHTEDDNIEAPVEGGEYAISFLSYYSSTYPWVVECVDGNDLPDWITVGEFEDLKEEYNGQIYYTGETNWTITVAANEGEAREADLRVFYDGAEAIIHVSQAGGTASLVGDVNLDGNVNSGDVSAIYAVILGTETDPGFIQRANVNGDDNVNTGDISALYAIMLGN